MIGRITFLVLDLGLDIVDGVGRLHLKGDGLPRKGLDEDLHLHERSTSSMGSLKSARLTVVTVSVRAWEPTV